MERVPLRKKVRRAKHKPVARSWVGKIMGFAELLD